LVVARSTLRKLYPRGVTPRAYLARYATYANICALLLCGTILPLWFFIEITYTQSVPRFVGDGVGGVFIFVIFSFNLYMFYLLCLAFGAGYSLLKAFPKQTFPKIVAIISVFAAPFAPILLMILAHLVQTNLLKDLDLELDLVIVAFAYPLLLLFGSLASSRGAVWFWLRTAPKPDLLGGKMPVNHTPPTILIKEIDG